MIIWPGDSAQSSYWSTKIGGDKVFRIAILSTPRTGNTWLRRLLDGVYSMPQIVQDNPSDVEWERLPPRCILQLHWNRDPAVLEKLDQYAFRKITICRHPLDVLISILHFSSVHADTSSWVAGNGGSEEAIVNVLPRSPAFLEYAIGPRADILLSVSRQWVTDTECLVMRYESLVREPIHELTVLCDRLQPAPDDAIQYAVQANTMEKLWNGDTNQHCWQGTAGHWRRLLPAQEAHRIAAHHREVFETLGYAPDPDSELTGQQADANWYGLEFASLKRECRVVRSQVLKLESQFAELRAANDDLRSQLEAMRADRWTPSVVARKVRSLARRMMRRRKGVGESAG
jgi:hypothetical protein